MFWLSPFVSIFYFHDDKNWNKNAKLLMKSYNFLMLYYNKNIFLRFIFSYLIDGHISQFRKPEYSSTVIRIFGQNCWDFDFWCADQMVAKLGKAHDKVDGRLLQVCGDLQTRVLPSGSLKYFTFLFSLFFNFFGVRFMATCIFLICSIKN